MRRSWPDPSADTKKYGFLIPSRRLPPSVIWWSVRRLCGMLDTLTYLKMGGRIPAALAFLGNTLHIKPVIELKDKKLVMLGKARGRKSAIQCLWKEFEEKKPDDSHPVYFGYTLDREFGQEFMEMTRKRYGLKNCLLVPVGGVIGTHVGPSCIAISLFINSISMRKSI